MMIITNLNLHTFILYLQAQHDEIRQRKSQVTPSGQHTSPDHLHSSDPSPSLPSSSSSPNTKTPAKKIKRKILKMSSSHIDQPARPSGKHQRASIFSSKQGGKKVGNGNGGGGGGSLNNHSKQTIASSNYGYTSSPHPSVSSQHVNNVEIPKTTRYRSGVDVPLLIADKIGAPYALSLSHTHVPTHTLSLWSVPLNNPNHPNLTNRYV